jgi:probable HAF family extracellular repeat protein
VAGDINNLGQVVGLSQPSFSGPDFRAVLWLAGGGMLDLGTLGGAFSAATAINDLEQIAGVAATGAGDSHAFLWQDGVMQDLGTLGGTSSTAADINELGQVVGRSTTGGGEEHAFLWQDGVMHDLGTLGGSSSLAFGINELGQVVGESTTGSGDRHAFLWQHGVMHDLGTLGGANSAALAINNHGDVAGRAATATSSAAVRWIVPILASVEVEPGKGKKPGGTVKLGGSDKLTVVVHGSRWFNAVNVDPATVTLGNDDGNDTFVSRKKGDPKASLKDVDGDGNTDLVLEFSQSALVQNGDLSVGTTQLTLLGDRMDGRRIRGLATVIVVVP